MNLKITYVHHLDFPSYTMLVVNLQTSNRLALVQPMNKTNDTESWLKIIGGV